MSIPTGFFTDITKNYYGIDPASQAPEEVEVSDLLWKDFLSKVATETDPYFNIISSRDEEAVRQALIAIASEYMSPLTEEALTDIGYLAHELVEQRGEALAALTSKDSTAVKTLLTNLIAPHIEHTDNFIITILPSIAEDIAVANGEKQKLYLDYLKGKLDVIHTAEATVALSMTEVTSRQLIYTIYDIILTLLNLITTNQIVESEASTSLVKKKEQYVELMRQLFLYRSKGQLTKKLWNYTPLTKGEAFTGTGPDFTSGKKIYVGTEDWYLTSVSFSQNPSLYNLGYGDLSLQDIFTSLYNNTVWQAKPLDSEDVWPNTTPDSNTFRLSGNPFLYKYEEVTENDSTKEYLVYRQTYVDITLQRNPTTGNFTVSSRFNTRERYAEKNYSGWHGDWRDTANSQTFTETVSATFSPTINYDLVTAAFARTYYNAYNFGKARGLVGVDPAQYTNWTTEDVRGILGTGTGNAWKYEYLAKAMEPKIPWGYIDVPEEKGTPLAGVLIASTTEKDDTSKLVVETARQIRDQQNKLLNTYLDAIRSKKEVVSDKMDSQMQVAETSATAKKNMVNILQAVIRQLQNMIASIYR